MKAIQSTLTCVAMLGLFCGQGLLAQSAGGQGDAKKIVEKIRKEMEEINRLLNEASRSSSSSSSGSSSSGSSLKGKSSSQEQLEESLKKSNEVIKGIDALIRMAGQGGGGGSGSKSKKSEGKGKGKGKGEMPKPDDRQGQNPDFMNQGEQEGKKPGQEGDPKSADKDPKTGKNIKKKDNRKHPTKRNDKKASAGGWGHLPPYLQKLFRAGGKPQVPARYREFEKEFYRHADKKKKR